MPKEVWTDYPRMEWWKLDPARWLLSRKFRAMPYQAKGPFCCICFELMREKVPGVVIYSDEQLSDWAMLSEEEWRHEKQHILKAFLMFEDKTLHQQTIKELFRDRCQQEYQYFVQGKRGAFKKAAQVSKKKINEPELPAYHDPYTAWEKLRAMRADEAIKQGGLEGGLWGTIGGLDGRGAIGGLYPPLGIREEERREDKIFSSTQASPPGDAEEDAVEKEKPSFASHLKTVVANAKAGK